MRMPVFFLSHGGGPWPYMPELQGQYALTTSAFSSIPASLPQSPKAVLVISGHWEAREFTVSTAAHPPMVYDYSGFPEHTYHIQYAAPGDPVLATQVRELLEHAGINTAVDATRGYDHGTFVPMALMYPKADIPIVMLSMKTGYDPAEHIRAGQALQGLRDEGVLIVGSGLSYHNMRGFGRADAMEVSRSFGDYLLAAIADEPQQRLAKLVNWQHAPAARLAHPREDHLIPLMVVTGAAGDDAGRQLFAENVMNVQMASYRFG